jgi:KaiC/GvpD/RAD55 family RecA-like ATPase
MSQSIREVFPGSRWLIRGQVPSGSYLLIGPTGVGKTIFCKQFLYYGLCKGKSAIFLSTTETPQDIKYSMRSFGFDVESFHANHLLRIVDCYSWKVGERSTSMFVLESSHNYLQELQINFDKARQNLQNFQVVFDSLADMALIGEAGAMNRFLQRAGARIRAAQGIGFFTIAADTLDIQLMNRLRIQFDGVFEMKIDEEGNDLIRLMRIFSLKGARHSTTWTPFEITNQGIVVKRDFNARCSLCGKLIEEMPIVERINDQPYKFDSEECVMTYKKFKELYGPYFE